ncbi:uncharacterized protein LOC124298299 isoform X1 [Neodiprion virginianus]|uniref:uncharacterized protein LOC124298299 isoform X1 n=1 Tax=Neodiprion virginianus TaxID=2961670 RepID=UPI001EE74047|nr:uncharacterized protein LOC124298299 isoform X1 [Neodiprion virginianus]
MKNLTIKFKSEIAKVTKVTKSDLLPALLVDNFICGRSKGEKKRLVELIDFFDGADDEWIAIFKQELVESLRWVSLLVINLISHGFTAEQKKQDFTKTLPHPNSLMDKMMKKYSYPKSEVTAGVGYGHHLHPLYYQGEKEMMYPCAVECGEWEAMDSGESINEASSNVDMVTTHPDMSAIDITTPKSRTYKDISFLRPKKYNSATSSATFSTDSASSKPDMYSDFGIRDSKGAGIQILPQKVKSGYNEDDAEDTKIPNDGSLYEKYRDSLLSRFNSGLPETGNGGSKENEYYDPMAETMGYNPPSFDDADDEDVRGGRLYRPKDYNDFLHPKREMIEEKYVKHDVREERLEDVRTNSFGIPGGGDDYSSDSNPGLREPTKYVDDYAAPQIHKGNLEQGRKRHPYRGGYLGSNYFDYGTNRKPIYGHKQQQKKNPTVGRRPPSYGRQRKYPSTSWIGRSLGSSSQKTQYRDAYQRRPNSYHPYSSRPVYSARGRFGSGGIQVVQPPQRPPTHSHQQQRYPDHNIKGFANSPYAVGHRVTYKRHIPQKNGFTKIIKRYKSFVNHMPKKYVISGEPYQLGR